MADPALHRAAGAPKHVAIGLEKHVSIKRTAERAVRVDRIPFDQGPSDQNALTISTIFPTSVSPQSVAMTSRPALSVWLRSRCDDQGRARSRPPERRSHLI